MPREQRKIPWLVQRSGVYYVMWYDDASRATKRQSLRTGDATEAQARYAAFLAEGGDRIQNASGKITVKGALDDYLRERVPQIAAPKRAASAIRHLVAFFGSTPLQEVDIPASRAYATFRQDARQNAGVRLGRTCDGANPSTIRRELVVLQAAANHALKWRRLDERDKPRIEFPRENPREDVWLTKPELERAIATATEPLKSFILITYYTGARRASVEGLTRGQVDLRGSRINLTSPHETQAQRHSNKHRPVVPIHPRIRPVIETLLMAGAGEYLFGHKLDMYRRFREHLTGLGMPTKAHPHVLRHSRATHLLQDGIAIYDVARLLGDTVATIEKTYGHHSADHLASTVCASI